MVFLCVAEPCGNDFVRMTVLEVMQRAMQLPVMIFNGAVKICCAFGVVVRLVARVVSVVARPFVFVTKQVIGILRAGQNAWNWAVSKTDKLVNNMVIMVIIPVSVVIPVLAVGYLYMR
jgi:hypothetical protein